MGATFNETTFLRHHQTEGQHGADSLLKHRCDSVLLRQLCGRDLCLVSI